VSTYNKAKGSRFEGDIEEHLNTGGLKARRLPRAGSKDIGDLAVETRKPFVIVVEAKNVKTPDMAGWLKEAEVEAGNYEAKYDVATLGVVVQKARGKGIGDARVTMTLDTFCSLLHWGEIA